MQKKLFMCLLFTLIMFSSFPCRAADSGNFDKLKQYIQLIGKETGNNNKCVKNFDDVIRNVKLWTNLTFKENTDLYNDMILSGIAYYGAIQKITDSNEPCEKLLQEWNKVEWPKDIMDEQSPVAPDTSKKNAEHGKKDENAVHAKSIEKDKLAHHPESVKITKKGDKKVTDK